MNGKLNRRFLPKCWGQLGCPKNILKSIRKLIYLPVAALVDNLATNLKAMFLWVSKILSALRAFFFFSKRSRNCHDSSKCSQVEAIGVFWMIFRAREIRGASEGRACASWARAHSCSTRKFDFCATLVLKALKKGSGQTPAVDSSTRGRRESNVSNFE